MPVGDGIDSTGRWVHEVVDQDHRFSLSTEVASGRRQLQVQIALGVVDIDVSEDLDEGTYAALLADPAAAVERAETLRADVYAERARNPPWGPRRG